MVRLGSIPSHAFHVNAARGVRSLPRVNLARHSGRCAQSDRSSSNKSASRSGESPPLPSMHRRHLRKPCRFAHLNRYGHCREQAILARLLSVASTTAIRVVLDLSFSTPVPVAPLLTLPPTRPSTCPGYNGPDPRQANATALLPFTLPFQVVLLKDFNNFNVGQVSVGVLRWSMPKSEDRRGWFLCYPFFHICEFPTNPACQHYRQLDHCLGCAPDSVFMLSYLVHTFSQISKPLWVRTVALELPRPHTASFFANIVFTRG